jgi:hypothetical protein
MGTRLIQSLAVLKTAAMDVGVQMSVCSTYWFQILWLLIQKYHCGTPWWLYSQVSFHSQHTVGGFSLSTPWPTLIFPHLVNSHSDRCEVTLHRGYIYLSLMSVLPCPLAVCMSPLETCLCVSVAHFWIRWYISLLLSFSVFYAFWTLTPYQACKYFPSVHSWSLHSVNHLLLHAAFHWM